MLSYVNLYLSSPFRYVGFVFSNSLFRPKPRRRFNEVGWEVWSGRPRAAHVVIEYCCLSKSLIDYKAGAYVGHSRNYLE